MRFPDRVAVVTGAASGMGLLAAREYAVEGARVVLTDVEEEGVPAAAEEIRDHGGCSSPVFGRAGRPNRRKS